ncbi:hypothetical protein VTJ04DRAFT_7313 [Mycothermus thermophilus]|uniref:uncharacterized protein n=1 Tax=Humicola insolens TaxID=85995 RepID=UPI0037424E7C
MPLRNPSGAVWSSCSHGLLCGPYLATCRPWNTRAPAPSFQHRFYASVEDIKAHQSSKRGDSDAPKWPSSQNPTPYEILGIPRGQPYNKKRFIQLAMLYHPDRKHATADDGIPHLTKLERYRLVVAAHELLSNPQKRRMYDMYGFGWDHHTDTHTRHREADRSWRHQPGNASMNATWEDWERWRNERDGNGNGKQEKQEEIFTSNMTFMGLIAFFLIIGTWSNMTRAGTHSMSVIHLRDEKHAEIVRQLRERQSQVLALDRNSRVDHFLRQREYEKWAYDPPGHGLGLPPPSSGKETPN